MIKSITFDGKKGYIGERYGEDDKPEKPKKSDWRFQKSGDNHELIFDKEMYDSEMKQYKSEMKQFKKNEGQYKVKCSEILVGRKFEFSNDKINLIFGPNASGKTTIIKSIASHAFCEDGFSKFVGVLDIERKLKFGKEPNHKDYKEGLLNHITTMAGTSSIIDWDGSPIYYHNFENRRTYGYFGELCGSIIGNGAEELMYIIQKGKSSSSQNMFYQFSKLCSLMSKNVTYEDLMDSPKKRYGKFDRKDVWRIAYDVQEEYYKSFPMSYDRNGQNTYLFDEIDKSMDILNINELYTNILPTILDKFGKQIIIISHSPIVLKDDIYESEKYNIISIDEEYTKKCRELVYKK